MKKKCLFGGSFIMLLLLSMFICPCSAQAACKSHVDAGVTKTITKRTCTSSGVYAKICVACNATISTYTLPAYGHSFGDYKVTKAATCCEKGTKTRTCSRCGGVQYASIPALGHVDVSITKTIQKRTCTQAGITARVCARCNAIISKSTTAAYGHSFTSYKTIYESTCHAKGLKIGTCSRCGATNSVSIPLSGHSYRNYVRTVAPNKDRCGEEIGTCAVCGVKTTRSVAKVAEDDYAVDFLVGDTASPYGYVLFNGVKYKIMIEEYSPSGSTIAPVFNKIAVINQDTRHYNFASAISKFSLNSNMNAKTIMGDPVSDPSLGLLTLIDLVTQIASNYEYTYKKIEILESSPTERYAEIYVGSTEYENLVKKYGTDREVSLAETIETSGGTAVRLEQNVKSFYAKLGFEPELFGIYDLSIKLAHQRAYLSPYYGNIYFNTDGEIVTKRFAFAGDEIHIAERLLFGYRNILDISGLCHPDSVGFIASLL